MIDIHTHILPHFDDGAKDTQIARQMLDAERAQGVKTVVITPHFYGKRYSPQQFLKRRDEAFALIKDTFPEGVEVRLGAEVHFTGINLPDFEELCLLAIEGTKCLLLEFPFTTKWTKALMDMLSDFIDETGYTPIIAHIERYEEVRKRPAYVTELVNMGCLLQVNAQAFVDKKDRGFAFALLKRGLVHCIGSDAHDMEMRSPDLTEAKKAIEKAGFAEQWERSQEITAKILSGEQPCFTEKKPLKKFWSRYY